MTLFWQASAVPIMKNRLNKSSFGSNCILGRVTSGWWLVLLLTVETMIFCPAKAQPPVPTGLSATAGNGQVLLTWNTSLDATSYNIYTGMTNGDETFAYNDSTSPGASTVMSLANGTTYYFEVTAVNSGGESAKSSEVSIIVGNIYEVAGAGTNGLNGFPDDWNKTSAWTGGGTLSSDNNYITTTMASGGPRMLYGITSNFVGAIWSYMVTDGGGSATNVFSGGTLTVSPGTLVGIKQFGNGLTNLTVDANLILNGGLMDWDPDVGYSGIVYFSGSISNAANSSMGIDFWNNLTAVITAPVTGSNTLTLLSSTRAGSYGTFKFTGDLSEFRGTLILGNAATSNEALELDPSVDNMSSLTLQMANTNTELILDEAVSVRSFSIGGNAISAGTYTASQLAALGYGGTFAGNGTLVVGYPAPPPAPTRLIAIANGSSRVSLRWDASLGAMNYNVKRSTGSGSETTITNVSGTSYVDNGLTGGTTYYYKISAVNPGGQSGNSSEVDAMVGLPSPLRVLPLGDSMTEGCSFAFKIPGGYRAQLYQLLTNEGFNMSFVGSLTDNPAPSLPVSDWYHEGHMGYNIAWVDAGLPSWSRGYANPDVVLLLLGTSDFLQNAAPTGAINRLNRLISDIVAEYPQARVIVANLLQNGNASWNNEIQTEFNRYVPMIVAEHQSLGQRVFFLDMCSAVGIDKLSPDGTQPTQTGYNKMAVDWLNAIESIITPGILDFNASLPSNLDFALLPSYYQPIPGLTISCNNVGLYNGGPDHTIGIYGANNYNAYQRNNSSPGVFAFSKPVSIPSVWLTTFDGGGQVVTVNCYSDAAGTVLQTNFNFSTPRHPNGSNYVWGRCTQLAALGPNIMNISFASSGSAQIDDMNVGMSTNDGPLQAVRLHLSLANSTAGLSNLALVRAEYQYASNVLVSASDGVTFTSSNTNVATVDGNGVVYAMNAGATTITATLQSHSDSQTVTVGNLVDFNVGLPNGLNYSIIPSTYQPIAGLTIIYGNVELYNGGPDHTVGSYGGNNYNAYQNDDTLPAVFVFNKPVSIPSLWLTTYDGNGGPVTINAYADMAETVLLTNINFTTPVHPTRTPQNGHGYIWGQSKDLAALGTNIMSISFAAPGLAQMDDMTVNVAAVPTSSTNLSVTAGNASGTLSR